MKRTDSTDADFAELVQELDGYLVEVNGAGQSYYAQFNGLESISNVVLAYDGDSAVGCGAFKPYDRCVAEIKRMFVRGESRGRRIGALILAELEDWALESGFDTCILETSQKLQAAVRLYQSSGYEVIPNYDQYAGVENSVCLSKRIGRVEVTQK